MEVKTQKRIHILDALRGFSLLGVILIHMQQHYSYFGGRSWRMMEGGDLTKFDSFVSWFNTNVVMGRFINIFAFLFGMSFFIQMDRAKAKGIDFRGRFCWRMLILFVIGIFSAAFYSGDILCIYAVFGLILLLLYGFNNKVLLVVLGFLLIGGPRIVSTTYDKLTAEPVVEQTIDQAPAQNAPRPQAPPANFNPEDIAKPSFISVVKDNLTGGSMRKLSYQFGLGGRGFLTLALFVLGLIVGRIRFFETLDEHKKRNLILFGVFTGLTILVSYLIPLLPEVPFWAMMDSSNLTAAMFLRLSLTDIRLLLYSAAIALGFIVLYQVPGIGKVLNVLAPYGRMGLTNFVMQSVIGAILFAPWGFSDTFSVMRPSVLFCIGIGIYTVQIVLSWLWLKYFKYGPLEWLWRSATYLKWQEFKK